MLKLLGSVWLGEISSDLSVLRSVIPHRLLRSFQKGFGSYSAAERILLNDAVYGLAGKGRTWLAMSLKECGK